MTTVSTESDWLEFDTALQRALAALPLQIAAEDRRRMYAHYQRLVEANRQFNLTRITSPADAAVKHYADSLSLLTTPWVDAGRPLHVLDVGTGAGFPAAPLAIVCPEWSIVAIDGTGKKIRFVADTAVALGLTNLESLHARAADLARQGGHTFDMVLVRAVGRIDRVLEETLPLLKRAGSIVFYKSAQLDAEEQDAATAAVRQLHLKSNSHFLQLPLGPQVLSRQLLRYRRS